MDIPFVLAYIPFLRGRLMAGLFAAVSLHIMFAGSFLLAGNRQLCYVYMYRAVNLLRRGMQHSLGIGKGKIRFFFNILFSRILFETPWEACECGIYPTCIDPIYIEIKVLI